MTIRTIEDVYNEISARNIPENFIQYCESAGYMDKYKCTNLPVTLFCGEVWRTCPKALPMVRLSLLRLFNDLVLYSLPFLLSHDTRLASFVDIAHSLGSIGNQFTANEVKSMESKVIVFIAEAFKKCPTIMFGEHSAYQVLMLLAIAMSYREMPDGLRLQTIENIVRMKPQAELPGPIIPIHASFVGLSKEELDYACSKKPGQLWRIHPGKTAAVLEAKYQYTDDATGALMYWFSLYGSLHPNATYWHLEDGTRGGLDWIPFKKQLRDFSKDYDVVMRAILKQNRRNDCFPSERPIGDLSTKAIEPIIHLL